MRKASPRMRRIAAAAFAVFVVGAIILTAATIGLGKPSVPSGDVAKVEDAPNGEISQAEFDTALKQTALSQQLKTVPKPTDPQYDTLKQAAMSNLIIGRWVDGEAQERGISVSDTEVSAGLKQFRQQNGLQSAKAYQQFLKSQGYTPDQALVQIRLQLLSNELQKAVLSASPTVSTSEVQDYYDANIAQFQTPETRDVRLILNKDQAKVEQAKAALGSNPTPADWKKVAAKYSTDQTTKDSAGLRQNVAQGQSEPTLDQHIFDDSTGQIDGPFKSETGYYLIQVTKVTPSTTTPLDKVETQIKQQLVSTKQQEVATNFQADFVDKWTARTECADDYVIQDCENFETPVTPCPATVADKTGCPAPVASTKPVEPGHATVFGPPTGLPQGPIQPPQSGAPAGGLPVPLGTPGAPAPPPTSGAPPSTGP